MGQKNGTNSFARGAAGERPAVARESAPGDGHSSQLAKYLPLGIGAGAVLLLDLGSKAWAQSALGDALLGGRRVVLIREHLSLTLIHNKGGAWGLLEDESQLVRLSFFLAVSAAAVLFIVSLYKKTQPEQRALRWGLPLVLGGALGNAADRILRVGVVDFIAYQADWVLSMNQFIARFVPSWSVSNHWPIFNIADVAICIGVALMAVDTLGSRRRHSVRLGSAA
jgi:signal peptidase II